MGGWTNATLPTQRLMVLQWKHRKHTQRRKQEPTGQNAFFNMYKEDLPRNSTDDNHLMSEQ